MADFPTTADLLRTARDAMLLKNSNLTDDILSRAGSDANALMAAPVAVGDAVTGQLIRVQAALLMSTAKVDDLDRLIFDRYQLPRKGAAPAVGEVEVSSPAPAPSAFVIPTGTQFKTADGRVYESTIDVTYPAASSGPVTVAIQSVLAGLSQQARAGTILNIITTISGAAPNLAVTNALATAGADDSETDENYRARGQLFYTTARRGTLKAIESGALAVEGVRAASAFEAIESDATPARIVQLVVTDAFTQQLVNATTIPASYEVQSQALALKVVSGLLDVRAGGIQVTVIVAEVVLLGVSLALRFRAGVDISATTTAARAAIVSYINGLEPGDDFIVADAEAALAVVPGLIVLGGEIVTPTGDVISTELQVFRTSFELVIVGVCE